MVLIPPGTYLSKPLSVHDNTTLELVEGATLVATDDPEDFRPEGFEWIDFQDGRNTTLSFIRKAAGCPDFVLAVFNFTPVLRSNYCLGVPRGGFWQEVLNSDAACYGGSGQGNVGGVKAESAPAHGRPWSVRLTLPPLAALFFSSRA